ncbi:hypothetical protein [Alkalibacterium gilvum]|uniref:hypothetical protein n=1 Tax=Alkalibacterium gilvum TaxID=1130080 RepID=UPI003F920B0E
MNEVTLKGTFLKELFKGRITRVCLFYEEQAGPLAIGMNIEKGVDYKKDCLIKVSVEGMVKQTKQGKIMYDNHLQLRECNYIAGVEK